MKSIINKKPSEEILNRGYKNFYYNWVRILFTILLFPIILIWSKKYNKEFWNFCQDYQRNGTYITEDNQIIKFNSLNLYYDDLKNKDLNQFNTYLSEEDTKNMQIFKINYICQNKLGKVSTLIIPNQTKSTKWVIGCHGWTENKFLALRLVDHFLQQGYNILTFDNIAHGETDGEFSDIGYSSNYVLDAIINFLNDKFNPSEIGLIGNSMGASTICYYLGTLGYRHENIKWAVADCGFADLLAQFRYVMEYRYEKPWWAISYGLPKYIEEQTNWNVKNYNILKNLSNIKIPILFAHGTTDTFVPVFMSKLMYDTKIKSEPIKKSELYLPKNVEHCQIISKCNSDYRSLIYQFIEYNT